VLRPGPLNAITDVSGVLVGHVTLVEGDDVRTGVTAILPHGGNLFQDKVPAGVAVGNGFGKFAGTTQIDELGETLLLIGTASAISATLYEKLPFNFVQDIAPVAGLVRFPLVMEVNQSLPTATVAEFIAYAKMNPGRINMASAGVGTAPHLAGEMFKTMAGVDMVHVPYRGEPPAITDMLGGRVQIMFGNVTASIEQIRSGALRALAVTTATRVEVLPDVPTVADTVPGYEASGWFGIGVPKGTPPEIIEKLNQAINAGLADPGIQARIAELGSTPVVFSPSEFGHHVVAEIQKWGQVVKASGAKPE
jgi:tripartite-type tricarboxylate transporter receptor subunit TctC